MSGVTAAELARQPFFARLGDLAEDIVDVVAEHARRVRLPEGHRLFVEGAVAHRWWIILDGRIDLEMHVPGKTEVVIESLGPGDVLGWSWLFPPYRWRLGAYVAEEATAFEVDAAALRERCETSPVFGRAMYRWFAEVAIDRLQATRNRLLEQAGTRPPSWI